MNKWYLKVFGLLDLICLILLFTQFLNQFKSFTGNQSLTPTQFFSRTLFIITYLSLIVSFIGHLLDKKWSIFVYYAQFIPRIGYFIFSFGFLSILTGYLNIDFITERIISLAIFGELIRLYFTIRIYQRNF